MRQGAVAPRAIAISLVMTLAGLVGATAISGASAASAASRHLTSETTTVVAKAQGPSAAAVGSTGRFVRPVELDNGVFTVAPAGRHQHPRLTQEEAAAKIWASPTFQGAHGGPLGYGLVSITLHERGVPRVTRLLAWVGFARHTAAYSCPAEISVPAQVPTPPSDGYAAVVIGAVHGSPAVAYTARSVVCGTLHPATTSTASEAVSIPWRSVGTPTNGALPVQATVPPCGTVAGITTGGSASSVTITVAATVPDVRSHCGGALNVPETVQFGPVGHPPGAPPSIVSSGTQIVHGPLGPLHLTD
jgi:hypothetical protein